MGINSLLNCCFKTCWVWSHDKRNAKFGIPGFMSCFQQVSVSQKLWCLMAMTAWHLLILWWWLLKFLYQFNCSTVGHHIPLFYWNIKKSNFEGHSFLLHFDISSCKFSVYCRWWHRDHNGLQTLWKISKIKSFIQQTILKKWNIAMFWNFITLFGKCVQVWSKKWNIMMQIWQSYRKFPL